MIKPAASNDLQLKLFDYNDLDTKRLSKNSYRRHALFGGLGTSQAQALLLRAYSGPWGIDKRSFCDLEVYRCGIPVVQCGDLHTTQSCTRTQNN